MILYLGRYLASVLYRTISSRYMLSTYLYANGAKECYTRGIDAIGHGRNIPTNDIVDLMYFIWVYGGKIFVVPYRTNVNCTDLYQSLSGPAKKKYFVFLLSDNQKPSLAYCQIRRFHAK